MLLLLLLVLFSFPNNGVGAQGVAPPVQLNLVECNTTSPSASLVWEWNATGGGPIVLKSTAACVTFDSTTTNLVMAPCVEGNPAQFFQLLSDQSIFNPSTKLCADVQYYGNTSGSVLGLYGCYSQGWDMFAYETGFITNTQSQTLCVSGGAPPPALPSPQQIAWMDMEISLMISYDLITQLTQVPNPQHFCIGAGGDTGFPVPSPTLFNPLNETFTDSWMQAAVAANAGYTLLVASHCSGFLQWQSNVTLPDGSPYPYTVAQSYWKGGKGDIVADYAASSKAAGLPFGFYLTWNYNYLFNAGPNGINPPNAPGQIALTLDQYHQVMQDTIAEVWGRYPDSLMEIWFDGGENNVPLNELISSLQPQAIATAGTQGPNYARLVGDESGYSPYPVWCANSAPAQSGSGNPYGPYFVPAEADTPVAEADAWFWKPNQQYRPIDELKAVYRNTVGANSLLELGVLPDNTGNIPADQMDLLIQFGNYVRDCHSADTALASSNGTGSSISFTFPPAVINRVILQEDLTFGQLVLGFTVQVNAPGGYVHDPVLVAEGTAIGHKRILYFSSGPIYAEGIIVTATQLYPGYTEAHWRNVAVFSPCPGDDD